MRREPLTSIAVNITLSYPFSESLSRYLNWCLTKASHVEIENGSELATKGANEMKQVFPSVDEEIGPRLHRLDMGWTCSNLY